MWQPGYPINFTSNGDFTSQAIGKHIKEIAKLYGHINDLRKFSVSVEPPADAEDYDVWLDPSTMELKAYFENTGWACVIRVQSATNCESATNARNSGNSEKLGGYLPSYFATVTGLKKLQAMIEDAILNPPDAKTPVFKGGWQPGGGYEVYDVVEYNGSSYVLLENDGVAPPADGRYWRLMASAGKDFHINILDGGRADSRYAVFVSGGAA